MNFEWIHIVEVSHVCDEKIWIQANESLRFDEIFAREEIMAFLLKILQELLLFGCEEIVDRFDVRWVNSAAQTLLHRELVLNHFLLLFAQIVWNDALSSKVV